MENVKVVKIGDNEYKFELDRAGIIRAEEVYGVSLVKIEEQLISQSYKLWSAGLHKHHNNISIEKRYDLFDELNRQDGSSMEVIGFLVETIGNFLNPTQK